MADNFDALLQEIGTRKWNFFYYIFWGYWFSCVSYQTIESVFLVPNVDHTCVLPESAIVPTLSLLDSQVLGQGEDGNANATYSSQDGPRSNETSRCSFEVLNPTTGKLEKEKCSKWEFDNTTFSSTLTSEFGLVCEWTHIRATYQSIYMIGILIGAGANGFLSDRFGRLKLTVGGSIAYSFIAFILTWLRTIPVILGARFLLGMMHSASLITGYVLIMEITEPKSRTALGVMIFITWSFGTSLLAGFAYLIRDWRWLQLAVSLPCLLFLPSLWFMDESPRWLVINGRFEEAVAILQKAARWNGVELSSKETILALMRSVYKELGIPPKEREELSLLSRVGKQLNEVIILFRTPKLRFITLSMYIDFFVVAMVYFGLSLGAGSFNVSPFLYVAITGLVEVPSHTISLPFIVKFGRKVSLVFGYFVTGACMLVQPLIPGAYGWIAITVTMIGKMMISTVFQILGLYSSELFPTEVRNRGLGSSMMVSRIGAIISPYISEYLSVDYPWAMPLVFGLASIIAGLVSLPLQETTNAVLPDTVAGLEGYSNPAMESDSSL